MATLEEIRAKYPQYGDLPDDALADALYNKYYADMPRAEFDTKIGFKSVPTLPVNTTPLDAPEPRPALIPGIGGLGGITPPGYTSTPNPLTTRAAQAGVYYDKPTNAGRFELGFAYDPKSESSRQFLANQLMAEQEGIPPPYRKRVDVRVGPETEELEYYLPDEQRYALMNQPGLDSGDVQENIAFLSQLGLEGAAAAAATAGASITGPGALAAGTAAGGFTAAFTEAARLYAGKELGLNTELTDQDIIQAAAVTGGISAAGGVGAAALAKVVKMAANFVKGRIFTRSTLEAYEPGMLNAAQLRKEMGRIGGDEPLNLHLGQMTGDPGLLSLAKVSEGPGPRQAEVLAMRNAQARSLRSTLTAINEPYGPPLSAYDAGTAIQDRIAPPMALEAQGAMTRTLNAEQQAQAALANIPTGSSGAAGSQAANALLAEKLKFRQWAAVERSKVDAAAGGIQIGNTELSEIAGTFSEEVKEAIFSGLQTHKRSLVGPEKVPVPPPPPAIAILRESMGMPPSPTEKLSKIFDPNTTWTFSQAWDAVSELKRLASKAQRDPTTLGPDAATYTRAYQALEDDMHKSLAGTRAAAAYDDFRAAYRIQKKLTDDALNRAMVESPDVIFHNVFETADRELADEVAYLIGDHPEVKTTFRNAIFDHWREHTTVNGRVDPKRHDAWLSKWGDIARPYLGRDGFDLLGNATSAEQAFRVAAEAEKATLDNLSKSFGGRLRSLAPDDTFKFLWGKNKAGEIAQFKRVAPADAVEALQRAVIRDMEFDITTLNPASGEREISWRKLENYLTGDKSAGRAELEELFGEQYARDLNTLREAAFYVQREPPVVNRSGTSIIAGQAEQVAKEDAALQMLRLSFGALHSTPYRFYQYTRLARKRANNVIFEVMMDPEKLRQFVELRDLPPSSTRAAVILGNLGFLSLWEAKDATITPPGTLPQ